MKKDKSCKTRKGESTIGKIIYGFLLFAPLIAILTACLTNIFTESQTETNLITKKYETNELISNESFIKGNIYQWDNNYTATGTQEFTDLWDITILTNVSTWSKTNTSRETPLNKYYFCKQSNGTAALYCNESNSLFYYNLNNRTLVFVINEILSNNYNDNEFYTHFSPYEDNALEIKTGETPANKEKVFYRAVNDVEESNIFNWSKNTAIYQGVYATANTLGISDTFIPMLLAYWLIISILYFIYDIVLMIILILHDKIHELQESI